MGLFVILSIVGLALILLGANYLTDGAVALAKKLNVPEIVIGLTIVAIGTSMPELVVSTISTINGQYDLAVGNVVGSNIFNVFVILGIVAMIKPVPLTPGNLRGDLPMCLLSSVVLWAACSTNLLDGASINTVTRSNGVSMLALFVGFIYMTLLGARKEDAPSEENSKTAPLWLAAIMIVGGLAGLIFGGELFIDNITEIARALNISESVISLTIVAAGTSMPELATSVVAMIKGRDSIALGNVVGSNIANVFLILGVSSTIHPLTLSGIGQIDLMMVMLASILMLMSAWTFGKKRIDRIEGGFFVACYIAYMIWLLS